MVINVATRIAKLPTDIVQLNKRAVHRQMDAMGLRQGIRAGTEMCSLGIHQESFKSFMTELKQDGVSKTVNRRDDSFGDYSASE